MKQSLQSWIQHISPDARLVMRALAFAVFPITAEELYEWLANAGIHATTGKPFSRASLNNYLDAAARDQVITRSIGKLLAFSPADGRALRSESLNDTKMIARRLHDIAFRQFPTDHWFWQDYRDYRGALNTFRLLVQALVLDNQSSFQQQLTVLGDKRHLWNRGLEEAVAPAWRVLAEEAMACGHLDWFPQAVWAQAHQSLLDSAFLDGTAAEELADKCLAESRADLQQTGRDLRWAAVLLKGPGADMPIPTDAPTGYRAALAFLAGDGERAMADFGQALAAQTSAAISRQEYFLNHPLFFLQAPLFLKRQAAPVSKLSGWLKNRPLRWQFVGRSYWSLFRHLGEEEGLAAYKKDMINWRPQAPFENLVHIAALLWLGGRLLDEGRKYLLELEDRFRQTGVHWYQIEVLNLLAWGDSTAAIQTRLNDARQATGIRANLVALHSPAREWEIRLGRLRNLRLGQAPTEEKSQDERLIWLVDPDLGEVEPKLQKRLKNGNWSVAKDVSLAKLKERSLDCLSEADTPVLRCISKESWGYDIDHDAALRALAGHPALFLMDEPSQAIELQAEEITLLVEEKGGTCTFRYNADPLDECGQLRRTGPYAWQVFTASDNLKKIAQITGPSLVVPTEGKAQVIELLGGLSAAVTVHSPLLRQSGQAREVPTDSRLVVLLIPRERGLHVAAQVRPLGLAPPLLRPAEGPAIIHGRHGEELIWTTRNKAVEGRNLVELSTSCPTLDAYLSEDDTADILELTDCLEILAELRDAGEWLTIEWPKGQNLRLHPKLSAGAVRLRVNSGVDWFELDGAIQVDKDRVLELRELLPCLSQAKGRFVQLSDGEFVELEHHLLQQLEHLAQVASPHGKRLRIPPLSLLSNSLLLDEQGGTQLDPAAADFRQRLWRSMAEQTEIPERLQAELRPYQEEGYRWLSRLAACGAGACLADDMGLGKTLQCLAVLLKRAGEGPSLVVAPTSVCRNWEDEIRRFTPDLNPVVFGAGDRSAQVAGVGPGDVLLLTYGLLVTSVDLIQERSWNVVVLDEAHAIKNVQTQRSKSVQGLKAAFRIAATGTPLQNHLGELWNLFEFLNPGLLGGQTDFNHRFLGPIERDKDERVRRILKDLIKPFLLRRTKAKVLQDLPAKSELTIDIELSLPEQTFYEALRQQALAEIEANRSAKAGELQIIILSQLMKLRRACCHPDLAGDQTGIMAAGQSSKITCLLELLEQLRENQHKVLVFSQFVDHLALIRSALETSGYRYEYLDGSMPPKARTAAIQNFQTGPAEVFLISLQAGGVGLNLTAADYVVHMDPWWNPAIEDQASDRAHRIGQTRPVTIYRLIARNTIESQIVGLHRTKRDLADALLEGTESAARLGADQLIGLIAEAWQG